MRLGRPTAPADGNAGLVLVVDDESATRELLGRTLEQEGYRVIAALQDGAGALTLARQHKPQAITLDVLMPAMDGWAVLAALKADAALADIPVVMVTVVSERAGASRSAPRTT